MGILAYSAFLGLGFRVTGGVCYPWHLFKDANTQKAMKVQVRFWQSPHRAPPLACGARYGSSSNFRPPQDTVLEALSEAAKAEGRIAQTTNIVMGGTVSGTSDDEWKMLNEKDEVKLSMSSKGRYVSVRIGPVAVDSSDQVQEVYKAMKRDDRMKYFL